MPIKRLSHSNYIAFCAILILGFVMVTKAYVMDKSALYAKYP